MKKDHNKDPHNIVSKICNDRLRKSYHKIDFVKNSLGIQSQFYRYAAICCKLHGDDFERNRPQYFRAWTIRGTLHIHHIEDYAMVIYHDMLTSYMQEFWDNETVVSIPEKEFYCEMILDSLQREILTKSQLIDLCTANGMTLEKKEYLFNPWGGLPRYLIETGKIVLTCNDDTSYMPAPNVDLVSREEAEALQVKRYLEGYSPCTIEDIMYFFKWGRRKCRSMTDRVLEQYFSGRYSIEKVGEQEYIFIPAGNEPSAVLAQAFGDAGLTPADDLYVLSAFDPLMLGYEKKQNLFLPAEYLREVFTLQGIVKPTILYRGRIIGLWNIKNKKIYVTLFDPMPEKYSRRMESILEGVTGIEDVIAMLQSSSSTTMSMVRNNYIL